MTEIKKKKWRLKKGKAVAIWRYWIPREQFLEKIYPKDKKDYLKDYLERFRSNEIGLDKENKNN